MIGNTNAVIGGGGGESLKMINASMTGVLTRNDAIYSGFGTNRYLSLAGKTLLDDGYFVIENKKLGSFLPTADNWEMVWKIKFTLTTGTQCIFADAWTGGGWETWLYMGSNAKIYLALTTGTTAGNSIGQISSTTIFSDGDEFYIKAGFTGEKYYIQSSYDGINYSDEAEISSSQKLTRTAPYRIGVLGTNANPCQSSIDLEGCYIKLNGNIWWKGVEVVSF